MKLLYIYDQMPETYQAYLSNLLRELKKKIDVKTLSYKENKRADHSITSYGVKDKLQRIASKVNISSDTSLDVKVMREYDIIHLQHSYLYPKLSPFFNDDKNKPKLIITLRGGDTYIKPWIIDGWKIFYKEDSKYIDAFVTVSQHQKEYLQKWGVAENKIHVIPVSFGEKIITEPKFPSDKTIKIVSAHRMCWEKNIEGNLRVIKTLKEKGQKVQYDIYGDGPDKGQLLYLIDKYNLKEEVSYLGKVSNEEFKTKLPNYDFFLQLSISEAFGASVIEAQSVGVPAIVSNSGGLPETIVDEKTGFCVDSWDVEKAVEKMINLFIDKEKYFQFSEKAILHSNANFSTENEIQSLLKLYKSFD